MKGWGSRWPHNSLDVAPGICWGFRDCTPGHRPDNPSALFILHPFPMLELREVSKRRRVPAGDGCTRELQVLERVSLQVPVGVLQLVVGPSGSGKSTLLRMLNRLEDPDSGTVLYGGRDVRELPVLELRRRVGMVQQQPALFEGTVLDNLAYGPRLRRLPEAQVAEKARRSLARVGLPEDLLSRPSGQLSGGQQHRISLARALANDPEALLLDEPTASLDPAAATGIIHLVASLSRELGLTVVVVTHSLSQVKALGGRIALLVEGRVVEQGETERVLQAPAREETRRFLKGQSVGG